jgi:myosin heavy subunit
LQYQLAQEEKGRITREAKKLQYQLKERLKEVSDLIEERQKLTANLEKYQKAQESRITYLEQTIIQLESQLETYEQNQLETAQALERSQLFLLEEIKRREQTIAILQKQIAEASTHKGNIQEAKELQQTLDKVTKQQSLAQQQLQQAQQSAKELQQQIALKEQQQQQTNEMVVRLQQEAEEAKERELDVSQQLKDMTNLSARLKEEKEHLENELKMIESPILNDFENAIFSCLEGSSKYQRSQWRILTQLDVSQNSNRRQVTDIIVISKACIFVLEAKYYVGKIRSTGDAKRTEWYCYGLSGSRHKVNSSGGENPYKQVTGYHDSVWAKVSRSSMKDKVKIFGVVVFPDAAEISAIESQIAGQYKVTTLEQLVQVLQGLETSWLFDNRQQASDLSPEQIENLLLGKPIRRAA